MAQSPDKLEIRPRLPEWLKVKMPGSPRYLELQNLMKSQSLHTVCEEAHCPNIGECWDRGTATFMILGEICTRACLYCARSLYAGTNLDLIFVLSSMQRSGEAAYCHEPMTLAVSMIHGCRRWPFPTFCFAITVPSHALLSNS